MTLYIGLQLHKSQLKQWTTPPHKKLWVST